MKPERIKYGRNVSPEVKAFLAPGGKGEERLREFLQRYQGGKLSRRGNHYDTERDYSFSSAETRTYHDRMVEKA